MKFLTLLSIVLFLSAGLHGQIVIQNGDMPQPGDTVRKSVTLNLEGIDFQSTGENYTWDFSELTVMLQQVDSFVSVSSTPLLYQAVFNNQFIFPNHKATVAKKLMEFTTIPDLEVTDTYQFYKNEDNEYREVGIGITLAGVPLPIAYEQIDTLYRFPLEYGDNDSAKASLSIDIPGLGYLGVDKSRVNYIDGWGTLFTPYGSFQTLRVRTEISEYDSVYIDSTNTGFPLNREYTEYKWFGQGFGDPLLLITEEEFVVTATYIDSVRNSFTDVDDDLTLLDFDFKVYPNPASDYLSVNYELMEPSFVMISFYSLFGREIKRITASSQEKGLHNKVINLKETGVTQGVYLIVLQIDQLARVKRVMIQ
jgi:hypothetical protein